MTQIIKENTDSDEDVSDVEVESNEDNESEDEIDDDLNISSLINHFFTNEEGENIAEILTQLKKSMDTQNKLIYKLLQGAVESKKK